MKSILYGFDKLDPDSGDRAESGAGLVVNMNPISGIYVPGPGAVPIRQLSNEDALPIAAKIKTVHSHGTFILTAVQNAGTPALSLYCGDLFGKTLGALEYDVTCTDGSFDETAAGSEASFCSFGETVYYASIHNRIISLDMTAYATSNGQNNFVFNTAPSGAIIPKAKYICSHGGHLVAANIKMPSAWGGYSSGALNPTMVWWSGFDYPTAFGSYAVTPELKGSDYKFLYDTKGPITGIVSAGDYLFVFKESSIYVAEGPPFRFKLLSNNLGSRCHNSLLHYSGWVYFMSQNGPARIKPDGQYENLTDGKTKSTLNIHGSTEDLSASSSYGVGSFNGCVMYPFSSNGIVDTYSLYGGTPWGQEQVYTALSEQYNIVYFSYPAMWQIYHTENTRWDFTGMVTMSYDITSGNIGYSYVWPSNQTYLDENGDTPRIPWVEGETQHENTYKWSNGTKNFFAMKTMAYKPSKGKSKDVIIIGTRDSKWRDSTDAQPTGHAYAAVDIEYALNLEYYYLDPTIFYGKNISTYTRSVIGTKIIRPSASKSKIVKVRPIIRFGYNSSRFQPVCQIASWSDASISGIEIYGHEPFVEFGPYLSSPLNLVSTSESSLITDDGSIVFNDTVFADEHIILFGFHTEADGGVSANPDFITTTGIIGLEIFYTEGGEVAR